MVVKESAGWKYTNTTSKNGEKSKELKEIVTGKYDSTELESRGRKTEFEVTLTCKIWSISGEEWIKMDGLMKFLKT